MNIVKNGKVLDFYGNIMIYDRKEPYFLFEYTENGEGFIIYFNKISSKIKKLLREQSYIYASYFPEYLLKITDVHDLDFGDLEPRVQYLFKVADGKVEKYPLTVRIEDVIKTANCHREGLKTICRATVDGVDFEGVARCNPVDDYDSEIGASLSFHRMLQKVEDFNNGCFDE